jgi:sulfur carrier protein
VNVHVNGKVVPLPTDCSISTLIEQMDLMGKRVAVELNLNIVPKSEHLQTQLKEGDIVEIVHAIGGG